MSASRTPLLLLVLALSLITGLGFWAYGVQAAETGNLQVFPSPTDESGRPAVVLTRSSAGAEPGAADPSPTRQPQARVHLELTTVARPLRQRESAVHVDLVIGDADRGERGRWVAGTASTPLTRHPRGQQLARFEIDGVAHYRIVRLNGRETGVVPMRRGMTRTVRGRVLDATGEPIQGARIWLAGTATKTDADGHFETAPQPVGDGMPLVVQADGKATEFRILGQSQCHALSMQPITMNRRGTRLRARFFGPAPEQARFFILPAGARDTRLLAYPLFMPAVHPVPASADGTVTFDGLPWGVRIRVMVQHPSGPPVVTKELVLDRFEARCVLHAGSARQLTGRVVDASGRGIPGAFLTARAGGTGLALKASSWLLPGPAYLRDASATQTTDDGGFTLPMVWGESRTGLLSIEAPGLVGLEYPISATGAAPQDFVLYRAGPGGRPELQLSGAGLPEFVHVSIRNDATGGGPYPWVTAESFELPLRRAALMQVDTRIDDGPSTRRMVFVDGQHQFKVIR